MKYASTKIVFQEVPNEVSLGFLISGCPLKCPGCHSSNVRGKEFGLELTEDGFVQLILEHQNIITCILFLGGEWEKQNLIKFLKISQFYNLKTCLYTGLEYHEVDDSILQYLDYIKVGPYIKNKGPLSSVNTNQKFFHLKSNTILNHYFHKKITKEILHATA